MLCKVAGRVGSLREAEDLPARDAVAVYLDVLYAEEIATYQHSLLVWAMQTSQVGGAEAAKCRPELPPCLRPIEDPEAITLRDLLRTRKKPQE